MSDSAKSSDKKAGRKSPSPDKKDNESSKAASSEKRNGNGSPAGASGSDEQKKHRSTGVSARASSFIAQAKATLLTQVGARSNHDDSATDSKSSNQTPLQKLGKEEETYLQPQSNNAAGESYPGPRSTFRVGVWEDRNKKCRRTMEDTHAFLYNFLKTPAPVVEGQEQDGADAASQDVETDNGYFAIFDGHAGAFAADWCGKKLHLILEDIIRKNPNSPIPELLDQTFCAVDAQLEKLPQRNSGCTAAIAVLRWEDRVPSDHSATGSQAIAPALARAAQEAARSGDGAPNDTSEALRSVAKRQRVLYTANVGDARIILCRSGKALRLSYDHKGSDENEGRRITNAGGLILNNRVNGVLAVTRALGDSYMKELVTGHPYTTETVIQPELDEFLIIACDGLWDVCSDQEAVELVRHIEDPVAAAKLLVDHALARFSTDNLSCMIVRFDQKAILEHQNSVNKAVGVGHDAPASPKEPTIEEDKIASETTATAAESLPSGAGEVISANGHAADGNQSSTEQRVSAQNVLDTTSGSAKKEPDLTSNRLSGDGCAATTAASESAHGTSASANRNAKTDFS
ncbi:phosphatase 2C-like protein [Thermochaetoides thermophila DSM 1495]|uniref:Phosphatase 2C-like protein n=1 Tax=Chaetomium thermophilum (strain DSM 1495 / CBS 144.50 / IMI 039719) TaxID=759272 RepID=G0S6L3_CHATD|nr:phosphatase 2C-like protein [Thermochaetoides thermophila DSM 1495]EGS20824.1 phosphatase 2C-like protein [Thermochaetoides thermophila DSM 1495]